MIPRQEMKIGRKSYRVNDDSYERFPVIRQAFVKVSTEDTGEVSYLGFLNKMHQHMGQKLMQGEPGFSQEETALDMGANTLNLLLGTYGFPNSQFLKWLPLFTPDFLQQNQPKHTPEDWTQLVKEAARLYGSNLTGVAPLDERWVYYQDMAKPFVFTDEGGPEETDEAFHIPRTMNRAIVLAFHMDGEMQSHSPDMTASVTTSLGYSRMGIAAISLAEYIRALGFQAIPCMNDTALSIPLAVDAGLGQLGRHGLLITPEYGPNVRLCKVLTDMPLIPDEPIDFGITAFCDNCLLCAKHCPSEAISYGEPTMESPEDTGNSGVEKWYIHGESCLKYWQHNGASCANCIAVCPFTYGYESEHCEECNRCEPFLRACPLQTNTHFRKKYGYLDDATWARRSKVIPPQRRGL
ncbi:MAG: reductive dehalogenase [Bacillota bacterium]|nr:reductive dehalogenase [Bacillota bacterium]MDW7678193.1 reductive dehalogenase [Bacillota bacterium]